MGADPDGGTPTRMVTEWFLVTGDRRLVAAVIVLLGVIVVRVLVATNLVYVGPGGFVGDLFSSGLTAGLITLLTLALSVNQLVLSRIFGSPNEFADRLAGSRELRSTVESLTDEPPSPIDPSEFLSLLATGLTDRAEALGDAIARQFFKTMALQQDFAKLSRLIISSGLVAIVVAIAIALVYRVDATTVPPERLGGVVSAGIGVVLAPLAAFVAYLARAATIAHRTVSVGPFVPPSK